MQIPRLEQSHIFAGNNAGGGPAQCVQSHIDSRDGLVALDDNLKRHKLVTSRVKPNASLAGIPNRAALSIIAAWVVRMNIRTIFQVAAGFGIHSHTVARRPDVDGSLFRRLTVCRSSHAQDG